MKHWASFLEIHPTFLFRVFHENSLGEEVFREIIPNHDEVVQTTSI
jgi:hypothetical protein